MSTFSGLSAATTALWAQRRALDVTGQNIANVNTEGYSRQRVDLQAIGGSVVPAFYSTSPGIGAGVSADDVTRIRDAFLEGRGQMGLDDDVVEVGPGTVVRVGQDVWRTWRCAPDSPTQLRWLCIRAGGTELPEFPDDSTRAEDRPSPWPGG